MRLHDFFDFHAREHPEAEFAIQDGRCLTYREALDAVNRQANAFIASDVARGDRVAILSRNSIEYILTYLAAAKAGAVLVPLNYRLAPPELAYIVADAQAKVVLAADEYRGVIDGILGSLKSVGRCIAIGGGASSGWDDFERWRAGQSPEAPTRRIDDTDDLYQMYTSGTTGRPKGAVLTHRAVTSNIVQTTLYVPGSAGERWLIVAPVYHAAAAMTVFCGLYWGDAFYVLADFDPAEVVRVLSEERIALTTLVPAMIQACLVHVPDVAERRYDTLRFVSYGGSPISEPTLRRAIEVFGCDFGQGYGMTETTAVLTYMPPADHVRALRSKPELLMSAGRALAGTEIRIVDEHDRPVPNGVTGQIIGRGPQMMRGYWNQDEASAEALRGGWMHTGDAGIVDDEGFVFVQDRVTDMIVSGGENIYPREVEDVLFQHVAVADVAVIGVPDERFGEAVKAVVVVRQGQQVTEQEVIEFCRDKLGGYKRPRSIDFVAALPRNPSGKVLKRELREPYWAGQRRQVG
jgi:acyl-CoA synthetase (AMP-forming)/AMP-acid ligase II